MAGNYKLEGSSSLGPAGFLKRRGAFEESSVPRRARPGSLPPIPEVANTDWGLSIDETELGNLNQDGPSAQQSAHWESLWDPASDPSPNQKRISPVENLAGTVHGFDRPTKRPPNDNLTSLHSQLQHPHPKQTAGKAKVASNSSAAHSLVQSEYDPQNALGIFKATDRNPSPPPQQKTFEPSKNPQYANNDGEDQQSNHGEETQKTKEQAAQEDDIPPPELVPTPGRGKGVKGWMKRQRNKLRRICLR